MQSVSIHGAFILFSCWFQVDISVCDEYQSCAVIPVDASSSADGMQPSVTKEVLLSAPDPRLPYFGWRLVVPAGMDGKLFIISWKSHTLWGFVYQNLLNTYKFIAV